MPSTSPSAAPLLHGETVEARAERLQRETEERDDVFALVVHELRNPLHALALQLGAARIATEGRGNPAEGAARIAKAQTMLSRYIDRATVLLDLARHSGNPYPINRKPVNLAAVLQGLGESLASEAQFHGVTLHTSTPPVCTVLTDTLAVEQVIDNLLLNAFKHASCRHVTLTLRTPESAWAEIEVADDGCGIAPHDQARLSGKFTVGPSGRRRDGSGLGLWIVRKLVDALGGLVTLQSEPSTGSAFTVKLPRLLAGLTDP